MTSYLDDTQVLSNTWNNNPGDGYGHLNIGADRTASSDYVYKGLIDDVRVYNQAPDGNDVYPSDDGLIGHWDMDEAGSKVTITAAPEKTAIWIWSEVDPDKKQKWGQAAGAFFRSIRRK